MAWATNLLAHRHQDLVEQFLDLRQALRNSQEHLARRQLRALAEQRCALVHTLTGKARQDAAAVGPPLSADMVSGLEETLPAAFAAPTPPGCSHKVG
ncbi:hypothetical protein [Kitasatospora sp. NPDC001547]|uniref:hypothetical protein n=1 Tax=Kitasatospora sp. NPDC001547 TaxID=3364015 RepID=UPI0036B12FF9